MVVISGIFCSVLFRPNIDCMLAWQNKITNINESAFYKEPDTSTSVGMQNQPKPTHHDLGASHAHLVCGSLSKLLHHAGFQVGPHHNQ